MQARAGTGTDLAIEQKAEIFRELYPLGDRIYEFMDKMQEQGFSVFLPRERFLESLARNSEELADHRLYVRELAKWMLALETANADRTDEFRRLCYPQGLMLLEEKRDKLNGVPYADLQQVFPGDYFWRMEADPCERHESFMASHDSARHLSLDRAWRDETARIFADEVKRHSTALSRRYAMWSWAIRDRLAFCRKLMKQELTRLGFQYDRARSSYVEPVYSKDLIGDWQLCFDIERGDRLFGDIGSGSIMLRFALRHREDCGDLSSGKALVINYSNLCKCPSGYFAFRSISELETIMRAYFCLYSLMGPEIEAILARVLSSVIEVGG